MNVENILKVADAIESHAAQFDMNHWFTRTGNLLHDCGLSGCIGGWANAVLRGGEIATTKETGEDLGLTYQQANRIFYPGESPAANPYWKHVTDGSPYAATPEQAVALLRGIASGDIPL